MFLITFIFYLEALKVTLEFEADNYNHHYAISEVIIHFCVI